MVQEGDESDGVLHLILKGHVTVESQASATAKKSKLRLGPPQSFRSSRCALNTDVTPQELVCDQTVIVEEANSEDRQYKCVSVTGFPSTWTISPLYALFKKFGSIVSIHMHRETIFGKQMASAVIVFSDPSVARHATETDVMPNLGAKAAISADASLHIPPRKRSPNASGLRVELIPAPKIGPTEQAQDLTSVEEGTREEEHLLLAVLGRQAYLDTCHDVINQCMDILAKAPKERSFLELTTVERMFSSTSFFQNLSRSTMIRKNCCRFLGILSFQQGKIIYPFGVEATATYIVIQGHVKIFDGRLGTNSTEEEELHTYGAGGTFGQEALTSDPTKYKHTAICSQDMVVAVINKTDYMRICNTDGMQAIIDKFWVLALQHSKITQYDDSQRDRIDFEGYKQLYLRIGKVITTKQMFSQKELRATMVEDWNEDLKTFGRPDIQSLDYDQYTDSLFQLIDEWSGGVESIQLYEGLLELMLNNFTTTTPDGELKLLPLKKVECSFQQLSNMKSVYAKKTQQYQLASQVGLDVIRLSAKMLHQKKCFRAAVSQKGLFKSIQDVTKLGGKSSPNSGDGIMGLLRDMFDAVDGDKSGELDSDEVAQLCSRMGRDLCRSELEAAMLEMDESGMSASVLCSLPLIVCSLAHLGFK